MMWNSKTAKPMDYVDLLEKDVSKRIARQIIHIKPIIRGIKYFSIKTSSKLFY